MCNVLCGAYRWAAERFKTPPEPASIRNSNTAIISVRDMHAQKKTSSHK